MKVGKETYIDQRDRQPKGGTYTPSGADVQAEITSDTRYYKIETGKPVLPGLYIWWSIHIDNTDKPDDLPPYVEKLSIPFSNPPQSSYGTKRISTTSLDLLQSYQDAFIDDDDKYPHLQFRNGGTLRYRHEICYVVIVCAEGHFTGADDDYPVIDYATNPVIPANIQYNDGNGRITVVGQWSMTIRNGKLTAGIIGKRRIPSNHFSWDHYVFAFHFPDEETCRMVIPSNDNPSTPRLVRVENVIHTYKLCIKKEPIAGRKSWGCPDQQ